MDSPGYHIREISKGSYGELSKLLEEVNEALDAQEQGCNTMILNELSDAIGAIDGYLKAHHPTITLADLIKMSEITSRAFSSGRRK